MPRRARRPTAALIRCPCPFSPPSSPAAGTNCHRSCYTLDLAKALPLKNSYFAACKANVGAANQRVRAPGHERLPPPPLRAGAPDALPRPAAVRRAAGATRGA